MGVLWYVIGAGKQMRTQLNTHDEQTLFVAEYAAIQNNEKAELFKSQF
jgi:hypothetical protein